MKRTKIIIKRLIRQGGKKESGTNPQITTSNESMHSILVLWVELSTVDIIKRSVIHPELTKLVKRLYMAKNKFKVVDVRDKYILNGIIYGIRSLCVLNCLVNLDRLLSVW